MASRMSSAASAGTAVKPTAAASTMRMKTMRSPLRIKFAERYRIRKALPAKPSIRQPHAAEHAKPRPLKADRILILIVEQVVGMREHREVLIHCVIGG